MPPLISVTDSKDNYDHLHNERDGSSEAGGVLLIWPFSEKAFADHRCSCGGLMERRKWQTL